MQLWAPTYNWIFFGSHFEDLSQGQGDVEECQGQLHVLLRLGFFITPQDGAPGPYDEVDLSLVIPIYNHGEIGFAGVITTF